jgi:hypothetical protein
MRLSYREELVHAMRELLPPQFFRGGRFVAARNGPHSGRSTRQFS